MKDTLKNKFNRKCWKLKDFSTNYNEKVWLLGDARSGTTWVGNVINYKNNFRTIFEPFHPDRIKQVSHYQKNYYLREQDNDNYLRDYYKDVFQGRSYNKWTNVENNSFFYRKLLVKDVFSNLLINWIHYYFKDIKILYLLRNPYSVSLSKLKLQNWQWQNNASSFFQNEKLLEDYLSPFESLNNEILKYDNFALNQFFIWCIINYVALSQIERCNNANTIYYNKLLNKPNDLFEKLGQYDVHIPTSILQKSSRVSKDRIETSLTPEQQWKKILDNESFSITQKLIDIFELRETYQKLI